MKASAIPRLGLRAITPGTRLSWSRSPRPDQPVMALSKRCSRPEAFGGGQGAMRDQTFERGSEKEIVH
jgi:hypothetical protein